MITIKDLIPQALDETRSFPLDMEAYRDLLKTAKDSTAFNRAVKSIRPDDGVAEDMEYLPSEWSLNNSSTSHRHGVQGHCQMNLCYMYSKHMLISENWNHHSYSNSEIWGTSRHPWNYRHVVKRRKNKGKRVTSKHMNQSKGSLYYLLEMNSKSKHIDGGEEGKCCILDWAQNMNEIYWHIQQLYLSDEKKKGKGAGIWSGMKNLECGQIVKKHESGEGCSN